MNTAKLVEKLIKYGFKYITKVYNSGIEYTINNHIYKLWYTKGVFKEDSPYVLTPNDFKINYFGNYFGNILGTTNNEDVENFFIISIEGDSHNIKFEDRIKMATLVSIMEMQIIHYNDKLINDALTALNEESDNI